MLYFFPSSSNIALAEEHPKLQHRLGGASRCTHSKAAAGLSLCCGPALFFLDAVWKRIRVERRGASSIARKMEGRAGRRESGEQSGPGSLPSLPRPRRDPRARGLASPPKPARAPAPPPLTGCRRPRSARRARCWGAAGSGTWRRRWERLEGRRGGKEGGREGASAARARRERLRRPWGSCTARPRAASRETSRGASGESEARRQNPAPVGQRACAPASRGSSRALRRALRMRASPLFPPALAPAGPRFSRRKRGKGERARAKMAAAPAP